MADNFPASLPGILAASNKRKPQNLVKRNEVQSGPPVFRLESDNGWVLFDVAWVFKPEDMQVFEGWERYLLRQRSRSFLIDIPVDSMHTLRTHECYFETVPTRTQHTRFWMVTATLLAVEQQTVTEDEADQLVILSNGFPDGILPSFNLLDELIKLMEEKFPWPP